MTDYHPPELPTGDNITATPQPVQAPEPSAQEAVATAPESEVQPLPKETSPQEIPPASLPVWSTEQNTPNKETQSQLEKGVESEIPNRAMDHDANAVVDASTGPQETLAQEKADQQPSEQGLRQATPRSMDEGVKNAINAGIPETVPENKTIREQYEEQGQGNLAGQIGENVESESKKEAEGQIAENNEQQSEKQPIEQAEQPVENTIKQGVKPADEPTTEQAKQPLQSGEPAMAQIMGHTPDETTQGQATTTQPETQPQVLQLVQQPPDNPAPQPESEKSQSSITKRDEHPPVEPASLPFSQTSVQPINDEGKEKPPS
ncbi:hypothetical protein PHISCL_02807 [Aspergillus sclerotialis]|uniref:Uncharacterized protein n=1 Tax=Aspergillus sclerotialis TaxID=2070753 RepID=A0A3A2ZRB1_9EURO|nr:hypothetical protein PHISCL_02807 [Aspergillus sclerotialis]